jgi:N-formylglutamate deformylase
MLPLPVIQSIPHGGMAIPPEIQEQLLIDDVTIYNECDLWADQIFDFGHADLQEDLLHGTPQGTLARVTMPIARVLIDANRDPSDLSNPDGAIKTQTSYGDPIYRYLLSTQAKQSLRLHYWQPFHDQLEAAFRSHAGKVKLFLDCHNMAQSGPSAYGDAGAARPFLCLANLGDEQGEPISTQRPATCPGSFIRKAAELAEDLFADLPLLKPVPGVQPPVVGINHPYAGGYILRRYLSGKYRKPPYLPPNSRNPLGLMIEVNRGLLVGNQTTRTPISPPHRERIAAVRKRLYTLVSQLLKLY